MKTAINGINIAYTDEGQGTPLVFLHGFPLSKVMWQPQVPALALSYRVITIDMRGHGDSDVLLWNFTLDDYARDVIGLLDHLHITRAVFVGLSMGGYVLFSLWKHFHDRITALVFAATRAQPDDEDGKAGRQAMAQIARTKGVSAIAEIMLPKLLAPPTIQQHPAIVHQVRHMILAARPEGIMVDLMAMAARPDSTVLLSTITCPSLFVVGDQDVATPVMASRFMAERVSGSTLITIPEAGHLSNLEQPAAFNEALHTFLQTNIK